MVASPPPPPGDDPPFREPPPSPAPSSAAALRLRRVALTVLQLLAPLIVLFAVHGWANRPALGFLSGTVTGPDHRSHPIKLPYANEHEPQGAKYHYELDFVARASPRSFLRIIPDDCVRSLAINGTNVPLSGIGATRLCDYRSGFDIDVGRFLQAGSNHVAIDVENISGAHGLAVYSLRDGDPASLRSIALLFLLFGACFAAVRLLPLPFAQQVVAAALLAVGLWLRYHFVLEWHPPESFVYSDMAGYVDRAHILVSGQTDDNPAIQPLGYSMALALSLKLFGDFTLAAWAHVLLGWGTVILVWRASTRWLKGWSSIAVLAIAALHVPFVTLSGFFLAETFFAFDLALLFYCLARFAFPWRTSRALLIGLVYMSALWLKGNNTFFGPLVVAWIGLWVISRPRAEWMPRLKRVLRPAIVFCLGAALVVASHATYTKVRYGRARLSASTSALNLVEGKCPSKKNTDSVGYSWQSPLFVQLGENEEKRWPRPFTDESFFWAAGLECIRQNPAVLATSVRYVYYLFFDNQLWPPNTSQYAVLVRFYGMMYAAFLFPGIVVGAVVIARRPRRRIALVALMGLSIMVCSWLFKSELRYRVPFDVVFIPMAVLGWTWVIVRLRGWRAKASAAAPLHG